MYDVASACGLAPTDIMFRMTASGEAFAQIGTCRPSGIGLPAVPMLAQSSTPVNR